MNAQQRQRVLLIGASIFTAWAVWQVRDGDEPSFSAVAVRRSARPVTSAALRDESTFPTLPMRVRSETPVRDLFEVAPPAGKSAPPRAEAPEAPPLPFSYVGRLSDAGVTRFFLSDGSQTLVATRGDRLAGGWKLMDADGSRLIFEYESIRQQRALQIGDARP